MLAAKNYDLTRDQVVGLIEEKCSAVGKDPPMASSWHTAAASSRTGPSTPTS